MIYFATKNNRMDEKTIHICQESLKYFLANGVKNSSMDDLSKHLRMSKKTLYQYVDNKEDLLHKVLDTIRKYHNESNHNAWKEGKNAIEVLFNVSRKIYEFQIKVKNPQLWGKFQEDMRNKAQNYFRENLQQGISEGFYRDDLDIDMTSTLYMAKIDGVHHDFAKNPEKYTYRQLFEVLFEHQIRAIATSEGLSFLEKEIEHLKFIQ
jgi:AcrR family transcriptional regulator